MMSPTAQATRARSRSGVAVVVAQDVEIAGGHPRDEVINGLSLVPPMALFGMKLAIMLGR